MNEYFDSLKALAALSLGNFNNTIAIRKENESEGSIEYYSIYSDVNLRDPIQSQGIPLTVVEYPYPDGVERIKPVSRTFYMPGFAQFVQFYHPNYNYIPENKKDYRRTLYWSPCLVLNKEGKAHVVFYNNSRTTHLNIEAEGLGTDGTMLWNKIE